jgi:stearoyl-CoA desaturase (delta-9 desaturase)
MEFLTRVLEPPTYGFLRDGQFYKPSPRETFREFGSRLNVFADRRNWLPFWHWLSTSLLAVPFFVFVFNYASFPLVLAAFIYSMVTLGSHGTFWLHRYGTHRAFQFAHPVWRFIGRNLTLKIIAEEIYIVSHHVHHRFSEQPGDPYNVNGGGLYCFFADATHQPIRRDLTKAEYLRVAALVTHTGVIANTYAQYQRWGSICHPVRTVLHYLVSWTVWYGIFYLVGGHALATALFGGSVIWAFGVRTYNYDGHGRGIDQRREGSDFNWEDLSVNQTWPGFVAGEWHNNHHLFPNGARSGFLPHQLDLPWLLIKTGHKLGAVRSYRDYKAEFLERHYAPYLALATARKLEQPVV